MADTVLIRVKAPALPIAPASIPVRRDLSLGQIADGYHGCREGLKAWRRDEDGWTEIPCEIWEDEKPGGDNEVMFTHRLHQGGGRNIFAKVAAITLAVLAPGIGEAVATAILPFGVAVAGATGSAAFFATQALISSAVIVGGTLLLSKLFPSGAGKNVGLIGRPEEELSGAFADVSSDASPLGKQAYLPDVIGSRRIVPPDVMQPRTHLQSGITTIDRVLALYGRHSLSEIRVDGTPADSISQITTETKDGSDAAGTYISFIDEISRTVNVSEQLSSFQLDGTTLEDQETPSNSEPRFHYFSTPGHESLEEIAIRIRIDALATTASVTQKVRIPLRISWRIKGADDWNNLPEIHLIGRDQSSFIRDIRLRWDTAFGQQEIDGELDWEFWFEAPEAEVVLSDGSGLGASPSTPQWQAHSYFSNGLSPQTLQGVRFIFGKRFGVQVILDETVFPKGEFEWRIQRGMCLNDTALNSSYQISGTIHSLFLSYDNGAYEARVDQGGFTTQASALQAIAVANEHPVQRPETAVIGLRSQGQSIKNITVLAAKYVNDWNDASPGAWDSVTATSRNPATHYYNILLDFLDWFGINSSLIDSDAFVAWRQECIDQGYRCSAVFAGEPITDVLAHIAVAGYARPVFSDKFTVAYFRDRSSDGPVQTFSHRNTTAIDAEIGFPERPGAYRATFNNRAEEWREDEILVSIDNAADIKSPEAISYKAIDEEVLIRRRAFFDLLQVHERRRTWRIETKIEGIICEIDDLVSLVTDMFDDEGQGARIRQVIDSTHLVLDQVVPGEDPPPDLTESPAPSVAELFNSGERSIIFVHTPTGVEQRTITGKDGNVVTLNSALSSTNLVGQHVNITTLTNNMHRCIVTGIERKNDKQAILTLMDEEPQIFSKIQERFG